MSITNQNMTNYVRSCAPLYANTIDRNDYLNGWSESIIKDDTCIFLEQQQNINFPRRHDNPTDDLMNYTNNLPLNTRHTFTPRIKEFFNDNNKMFYNPNFNMDPNYNQKTYGPKTIIQKAPPPDNEEPSIQYYIIFVILLFIIYKLLKK